MTAHEEMRWIEQWTSNYGAEGNDNKTTMNSCAAAEAEDNDGWQEAGRGGGGGGATVMQRRRRYSFTIRSWMMEVEDFFLGGD